MVQQVEQVLITVWSFHDHPRVLMCSCCYVFSVLCIASNNVVCICFYLSTYYVHLLSFFLIFFFIKYTYWLQQVNFYLKVLYFSNIPFVGLKNGITFIFQIMSNYSQLMTYKSSTIWKYKGETTTYLLLFFIWNKTHYIWIFFIVSIHYHTNI